MQFNRYFFLRLLYRTYTDKLISKLLLGRNSIPNKIGFYDLTTGRKGSVNLNAVFIELITESTCHLLILYGKSFGYIIRIADNKSIVDCFGRCEPLYRNNARICRINIVADHAGISFYFNFISTDGRIGISKSALCFGIRKKLYNPLIIRYSDGIATCRLYTVPNKIVVGFPV
ncbi:MAG TPA: DUF4120 family protein [Candidatus Stercoripulliclostridium merdipullorum]|uniref:DUF4120 family protein n=1 Tax=Candidatus Stercoripulliclostridium merdipullorum TaxID=2840952 RepID=A0A9D1SWK3_9FIRM|nr:DUF4120 family protein [Candidatus Stercoripulliclostridium merdipullorum]